MEACEMHSEDDKALSEKNKKRTVKSDFQRKELEKFYDEHKYPTESMKLEVAKRIGLTEKQISSWFCHRRLKDKKLLQGETHGSGRQDRSSGVIQDVASGLRQDSCGSTKQGDEKNYDAREVESRILAGQEISNADLMYERGNHHNGNFGRVDDTSSESNSSLRNMYFKGDPVDVATSGYASRNLSIDVKGGGKARSGPSGYLKVKGRVENAAITAVKRQLGRQYREDGPPLGTEFDPLPPGAFESSGQGPVTEPYYAGEHAQHHSPNIPRSRQEHLSKFYNVEEHNHPHSTDAFQIRKQHMPGTGYGYTSKRDSQNADLDVKKYNILRESDHSENVYRQKPEQKNSLSKHRQMDVYEHSAREVPISDSRVKCLKRAASGVGGLRTDQIVQLPKLQPSGEEGNPERARPWLNNKDNNVCKVPQGGQFQLSYSDLTNKRVKYKAVDGGFSRKVAKVGKICDGRRVTDEGHNHVQVNFLPKNETRNYQLAKDEYFDHEHATRASREEVPRWTNHQIKRPAAEMPSSFSEDDDESAETDSSVD